MRNAAPLVPDGSAADRGEIARGAGRARLTLVTMGLVALGSAVISVAGLYRAGMAGQRERLQELARSQAHLIDAVARFDAVESRDANPAGAWVATLGQVADGVSHWRLRDSVVSLFVVGRAGSSVVTHVADGKLLAPDSGPLPAGVPLHLAERALGPGGGEFEYETSDGSAWFVVFEPISALDMAVMARLDLSVIHRPLREAAGISALASLLLIGLGVFLVRSTNVRAVQQLSAELERRLLVEAELSRHQERLETTVEERTLALKRAQAELVERAKLATIGELTAKVSHELRNPLGTVRTTLHTLRERARDPALDRAFERAERNVERCNRIIEELLAYTRRRPVASERFDVAVVLGEVLEDYQAPDNVRVEVNFIPGLELEMDPEDLRRILVNLLNNAVGAVPSSAGVSSVYVNASLEGDDVCISVEDNGTGMDALVLARAFEPLFSTKGFGVGLGLPIVKELTERNGGVVELESSLGHGTLARVRFRRKGGP